MNKQVKILIILGIVLLLLVIYIVISSRVVTISSTENTRVADRASQVTEEPAKKVDPVKLKNNYENNSTLALEELGQILVAAEIAVASSGRYAAYSNKQETTGTATSSIDYSGDLAQLKIDLMDLLVPENYKDIHFNLVLAIAKFKEYMDDPVNTTVRDEGIALLNKAVDEAEWF